MKAACWLIGAAALVGCTYSPKIRPGIIECQSDGPPCPAPYACVMASETSTRGVCDLADGATDDAPIETTTDVDGDAGERGDVPMEAAAVVDTGRDADAPPGDAVVDADAAPPDIPADRPDAAPDSGSDGYVCPSGRGPQMVNVSTNVAICIDSTEVTNLQYKAFLDDPSVNALLQPEICRNRNDGYAPVDIDGGGLNVATRAQHPVVNVDWCDAAAFCKWSGKRLCGAITGGPLQPAAANVATHSQWAHACTQGGAKRYPYDGPFDATACNIGFSDETPINTVPVGSKSSCVGGYPGIYDMVGNVEEWIDFCHVHPVDGVVCGVTSSPYTSNDFEAQCASFYDDPITDTWVARGFRCCAP